MVTVLCNDSEIKVEDDEVCEICGLELEEYDQVTDTGIHGYHHGTALLTCTRKLSQVEVFGSQKKHSLIVDEEIAKPGQRDRLKNLSRQRLLGSYVLSTNFGELRQPCDGGLYLLCQRKVIPDPETAFSG
jgi:hypothetical protein